MIYSYLWPDQTEAVICLCGRHHPLRSHLCDPKVGELWTYAGSHLPRVCRQLRHEALGHFFSSSQFVLPLPYIIQAHEEFKLEDRWERFVANSGAVMIRQTKRLTVLAGNINKISVDSPPDYDGQCTERELLDQGYAIFSSGDVQCAFARRGVRPRLHPDARMLVVFEHQDSAGRRTCIDFDDREATSAQIHKDMIPKNRYCGHWTWQSFWPDLLAKWYGDSVLHSCALEDTIWELMLLDDVSDESPDAELELETLAGLLNIVCSRDLGPQFEKDEDTEISIDDFIFAYASFSGKQIVFSLDQQERARGGPSVAIDLEGSLRFEVLSHCLQNPTQSLLQPQDEVRRHITILPDMDQIFAETSSWLWDWERERRLNGPRNRRLSHTMP